MCGIAGIHINNPKRYKELEKVVTDSLKSRKIWLAASTHKNEEKFCLRTHQIIKNKYPNILTIIAPRHINRTREIMNEIKITSLFVEDTGTIVGLLHIHDCLRAGVA